MLSTGYSKRQDLGIDSSFGDSHQVYNKASKFTTISGKNQCRNWHYFMKAQ